MAVAIDPVCGMEVDMETATLTSEHDGTTYYFCGKGCGARWASVGWTA